MQWYIYVQYGRHVCSEAFTNNVKVCIAVFLIMLLISVSSYEAYILTHLSPICTGDRLPGCCYVHFGQSPVHQYSYTQEDGVEVAIHR